MNHLPTFQDTDGQHADCSFSKVVSSRVMQQHFAVITSTELAKAQTQRAEPAAAAWARFSDTWNDLAADAYMADGGRYRRRRYASFAASADGVFTLNAHRPHFQAKSVNHLNGGIDRWFEPILPHVLGDNLFTDLLGFAGECVHHCAPDQARWDVEVHQFRITAMPGHAGLPTPEGLHQDGVDFVFMTLIKRVNVAGGVTEIANDDGAVIGTLEMSQPGTSVLLNDRRTRHGVSAITAYDGALPAYRDMLVVTFRAFQS